MKHTTLKLLQMAQRLVNDPSSFTPAQKTALSTQLADAIEDADTDDKWWLILLKVLAYAIGLILAGMGTTTAACMAGLYLVA